MTTPPGMRAVVPTGHGGLDKLEYRQDWSTQTPGTGVAGCVAAVGAGVDETRIGERMCAVMAYE